MLDWAVVAARAGEYVSTLLLFGAALFYLCNDPTRAPQAMAAAGGAQRILRIACAFGLLACLAFLLAETVSLSGVASDAFDASSLWSVVSTTRFGALTAVRFALLVLCTAGALALAPDRRLWLLESTLGGCVVVSYAWTGHGAMNEGLAGAAHLGADILHLLTAGLWFGALVALGSAIRLAIRARTVAEARAVADSLDRFSAAGIPLVAILAATGLVNACYLIGASRWLSLFTSAYGRALLVKLTLFVAMLALAGVNRLRLAPRLRTHLAHAAAADSALRRLRLSLASETLLALLVLAAVAVLGVLEPPVSES